MTIYPPAPAIPRPGPDSGATAPRPALRIAMVVPPWFPIPPAGYGGIEWICHWLVEALVARGNEVFLVGPGQRQGGGTFFSTGDLPDPGRLGEPIPEVAHAAAAANVLTELEVDVVHDHSLAGPLLAYRRPVPTVVTAHGPVGGAAADHFRRLGAQINLMAISEAQRQDAPELPWSATVHNGIPVEEYPVGDRKENFVVFLGRMNPDKAAHLAIDAAREAGVDIVVAAKCNEPNERAYFEQEIEPRLGPGVSWVGEADTETKKDLLARARGLLLPLLWNEPFGIVMVEALACGTPVIAFPRGAAPEIVSDGVNGFLCPGPEELPGAIAALDQLDPQACRESSRAFDVARMAEGYEQLYRKLATGAAQRDDLEEPATLA
jgi:glycosyltransferase involved in cell wall biosynthesis